MKKIIKTKNDKLFVKWRGYSNNLIHGLVKKI